MNFIKNIFFDSRRSRYDGKRRWREGWVGAAIGGTTAAGLAALILAFGVVGVSIDRHFSQKSCEARIEQIGNERFDWYDFTFFDYGCLEITDNGTTGDTFTRIVIEDG